MTTIAVWASAAQKLELEQLGSDWEFTWLKAVNERCENAMAYFVLQDVKLFDDTGIKVPIFVNSVVHTLAELGNDRWIRINGWSGFLQRKSWEGAGTISDAAIEVMAGLNVKLLPVTDEPGLIAARTIAMLINEAWFAWSDGVSSREEIDIAMRLGTNYPFGLFEWGEKIGLDKVVQLLDRLQQQSSRYIPCNVLKDASQ